jgi:hypothetical protein
MYLIIPAYGAYVSVIKVNAHFKEDTHKFFPNFFSKITVFRVLYRRYFLYFAEI